ncbi:Uncharacterized protein GY17_00003195 [Cryptosporidium hominis]|nr:Rab11 [Cryptosporidium hominis TU502]PPS93100.1 Uncharacterized protein GY17_00003195 [Cryptosporidium hominis]|eukprot:PPS93100.1 Uncharacterized protein GY17_00003195 [Cryptosporidium hominis]
MACMEASALNSSNVDEAFHRILSEIYTLRSERQLTANQHDLNKATLPLGTQGVRVDPIRIDLNSKGSKKRSCC